MPARFLDSSGRPSASMSGWDPIVVKKAEIDAEIERLAALPRPDGSIRAANIAHPMSNPSTPGIAPGIDITVSVLKPGETSAPMRQNASQVTLCIGGSGEAQIGAQRFAIGRHDIWNTPSMRPYTFRNTGTELLVRLTYSNATLLKQMRTHFIEVLADKAAPAAAQGAGGGSARRQLPPPIPVGRDGAQLLTYEHLIDIDVVENKALHWSWQTIAEQRDRVFTADNLKNKGRRGLFVLYNPATGRTQGATHSFFATVGFMPENVLDFPHRHSSNAINYCLEGGFVSEVNGQRLQWDQGDIAYTAPGWSAHANGSERGGTAMTIQDHPFQIATESLVWQEGEGKPIRLLGSEQGFASDDTVELATAA